MYIQVNIGRNYNTSNRRSLDLPPLTHPNEKWSEFVEDVSDTLRFAAHVNAPGETVEVHYGGGAWARTNEESAHISLYSEAGFDMDYLRSALEEHRFTYSQDAIALIVGSELIGA